MFRLLENLFLLLFLVVLFFEVILPMALGRKLFPHFRWSSPEEKNALAAAKRLEKARVDLETAQLLSEAKKIEELAQKVNNTGEEKK